MSHFNDNDALFSLPTPDSVMKEHISSLLTRVLTKLQSDNILPVELLVDPKVDNTKDKAHGDFASNIAMVLAKQASMSPRSLAEKICQKIQEEDDKNITKTEIAGPGIYQLFCQ